MPLKFVFGPSGSGKSTYLYQHVIEESEKYPLKNFIVLVPEQFTMQTQKDLVSMHPRHGIMNIDVLSFARLAYRVFEETGTKQMQVLDDEGKNLILRKIAGDYENKLTVLKGNIKKLGYISEVKSVISEFTQYDIGEEEIDEMLDHLDEDSRLYYKLKDIRLLYEGFQDYLRERYITKEELLDVLNSQVKESELLKNSVVVLDGFTGFTPVQNRLILELMRCCKEVWVTVTMDERENPYAYKHPYQLFGLSKQMITTLVRMAGEDHIEVEEPVCLYGYPVKRFEKNQELAFLERNIFRYGSGRYDKAVENLEIHAAGNPRQEADAVAEGIRRLREGKVERRPGYDGEYGTIRLFDQMELDGMDGQLSLFTGVEMAELSRMETAAAAMAVPDHSSEQGAKQRTEGTVDAGGDEAASHQLTSGLNPQQEAAVTAISRTINVAAGPGTGKTKTLVAHAFHLLEERGVKPTEMTAVTFTNQAAREMRERLESQLGGKRFVSRMRIGTFHSICYDILKKSGLEFTLADELEMKDTAEEVIADRELNLPVRQFLRQVSARKCGLEKETESVPAEAYEAYQRKLKEQGILDFDDLLLETLHLFEEEGKNKTIRQGFSYLLVDEFQDISPVQYRLIQEWNKGGRELFVIGDPDQAIYSFRGSDARCFEKLREDYPQITTICLEQNYRSTPQILEAASGVISQNDGPERRLIPQRQAGTPVRLVTASGEMSEDIFVAKEINRLIGGIDMLDAQGHLETGDDLRARSFSDIAVLYRTNRQAELLETCLKKEGIPYVVAGREDFLMEPAVRGTLCFFKALLNPEDRTVRRLSLKLLWKLPEDEMSGSIFDAAAEKYRKKMKKEKPQKLLEAWVSDMNLQEEEGVAKLASMSVFYKNMAEFLDNLTFGQESDIKRCGGKTYTSDSVTLMTLHGSKGLEFPVVLMCGVRKGLIPLESGKQDIDEAEERRLFYVGMTRAKDELLLITSQEPSPFLEAIPKEVTTRENAGKQRDPGMGKQMSLFDFMQP